MVAEKSLTAIPMRFEPRSIPSAADARHPIVGGGSRSGGDRLGGGPSGEFQRRRNPADVLAARRGDVALAAATTADRLRGVLDQVARRTSAARLRPRRRARLPRSSSRR